MNAEELKGRTKAFAVRVIEFVEHLERSKSVEVIGKQLIRSATSVAANYRAACRSRSKADFANKLGIIEEEADETLFWLEMLIACNKTNPQELKVLMDESDQLLRIFAAAHITAKANRRQK